MSLQGPKIHLITRDDAVERAGVKQDLSDLDFKYPKLEY